MTTEEVFAGWTWLDAQPATRWLPINFETRRRLAKTYWRARSEGQDHAAAKQTALKGYGAAWIQLLGLALWVLFKLLERWWDTRNAD